MIKKYLLLAIISVLFVRCSQDEVGNSSKNARFIEEKFAENVKSELIEKFGQKHEFRIKKGVEQVANFWRKEDGDKKKFKQFCEENFISDEKELEEVLKKISGKMEILYGKFHQIDVRMKEPLHLDKGPVHKIDRMFAEYSVSSHLKQDFYKNKIAFYTLLNYPHYSLDDKNKMADNWDRQDWAMARMGDIYTSRVPSDLLQNRSEALTKSDSYISEYNIYMGNLRDEDGNTYFSDDLRLITHWGLRDELKSNYNIEQGKEKQEMIYEVMLDIINQDIPSKVINNDEYMWNPITDKLYDGDEEIEYKKEPDTRYEFLRNNFKAVQAIDPHQPFMPTYIQRAFEGNMELTQEEVETLFVELVSSPQVKKVGKLIEDRLGRNLRPYDIWYNGFTPNEGISEDKLDEVVSSKYPTREAFENDLPNILIDLGFDKAKSNELASLITVDASRGAGHAWGAAMRDDIAHLRTRIGKNGMDYKGYNIAIHEFGHTVEQTITMNDVEYYMLNGVPNTAFTEAIAFLFQKRDLELLDMESENDNREHLMALNTLWSCYEIMGVSLVDMNVWKWMYENPDASKTEVKEAVIRIAKEIWNKYYAEVFGEKDSPILAVYSHMIDNPLYLSNYPLGHLVHFQIEQYVENKEMAEEITRMLQQGSITPQQWMKEAVGDKISNESLLDAVDKALKEI